MPKNQKGAGSILIVIFLTVILAVGAFFIYQNSKVNLNSGASNVVQSMKGKLVKKGTTGFAPCGKDANFTYGLVGVKVLGLNVEAATGPTFVPGPTTSVIPKPTLIPTPTPILRTPTSVPGQTSTPFPRTPPATPKTPACIALSVQARLADQFVGKQVTIQGTYQGGIFYVTSINGVSLATPSPRLTPTPSPYIHVQAPNGGETYSRGQTVQLAWQSGGISNVSIYVVNANGVSSLINGLQSNPTGVTNYYNWTANPPNFIFDPNTSSNSYTIRITDSSGKYLDNSDSYFKIVPMTSPTVKPTPVNTPIPGKVFNGLYMRMNATCTGSNKLFNITASGNMPTFSGTGNGYWVVFTNSNQHITWSYQDQSSTQIGLQSYNSQFFSTRSEGTMTLTGDNGSYQLNVCYEPYTTGIPSCSKIIDQVNFAMSCP